MARHVPLTVSALGRILTAVENPAPLTDPTSVLIGLGALSGLVAALCWLIVRRSIDTSGEVAKGPDKRALGAAATFTAMALALASLGYLLGRFTGRF